MLVSDVNTEVGRLLQGKTIIDYDLIPIDLRGEITCVTIPATVKEIGRFSFCGCRKLASISIPDSVEKIGPWAFSDCRSLTSVFLPDSVAEIGAYAFSKCESLSDINVTSSISKIGPGAFRKCYSHPLLEAAYGDSTDDSV